MESPTTDTPATSGSFERLSDRLKAHLARNPHLIGRGARVLVATSGGPDSLALLHLLHRLAWDLDLHVAHFDHAVRPGSARVATDVARQARDLGLPYHVERANRRLDGQDDYREARLAFLDAVADRIAADRIALAHHADDQVETILLRLVRGTGLRGLRGIPELRGRYSRPLLPFRPIELQEALKDAGFEWHDDPANVDPRYARSRTRTRLLPALRDTIDADSLLLDIGRDAAVADRALDSWARPASTPVADVVAPNGFADAGGVQIARSEIADYDPARLARLLRILARDMGFRLTHGGTRAGVSFITRGSSGQYVDLGRRLRLVREFESFRLFELSDVETEDREVLIPSARDGHATATLDGRAYRVVWGGRDATARSAVFDPAGLAFPLRVRAPRPGDRVRTNGGMRKLKKVLGEQRVPITARAGLPVLETADGRVVWVAGCPQVSVEAGSKPDESSDRFGVGVNLEGVDVGQR